MGKIINSYILPHPPIIVPEIGKGREMESASTVKAVKIAAEEIARDRPSTIILSSPHAPCFRDYVYIADTAYLTGSFAPFGVAEIELKLKNNLAMTNRIIEIANAEGIAAGGLEPKVKSTYGIDDSLDHGALVPLYFILNELKDFNLVHISTPFLELKEIFQFGKCIAKAVEESDERVVYVASGDLSHRLTEGAPAGYHLRGREYDEYLINNLKKADIKKLLHTEESFMEEAGECGTRSFIMMLGALNGLKLRPEIYSYEGPFGVGYLVAKMNIATEPDTDSPSVLVHDEDESNAESSYVRLARETLETYVKEKKRIDKPDWLPADFLIEKAGVFVSLKKNGHLRGCIGTIGPTKETIADEIISNAISAGISDPRFEPVKEDELPQLTYSVDVLGRPEIIESLDRLDVKRYGVIVSNQWKRGLLLPDLEGVDTPEMQVGIALQKAGINPPEPFELERFEVVRYK